MSVARALRLVTGGPERRAIEAGEIDAVIDSATGNVFLLPQAKRALSSAGGEAANGLLGEDGLDALVNNAAQSPKTSYRERLGCLNGDLDGWRAVFELNFFAALSLSRGFAGALHRAQGCIVNITSIAGHATHPFAGSAYSTSKAALSALTREMAVEFAELGVRVNAVAPGEIETEMVGPEYESLIPRIPLGRMGTSEEVASVVFRLCGEDFAYVTGTELFVTGGQHLF